MELMFDLETLDTNPSAIVLSLGAVLFEKDGTIAERFYRTLSIQEQIDAGRTISENTLLWWLGQDPTALAEAFAPVRQPVGNVLDDFAYFISAVGKERHPNSSPVTKFWCNGPSFDGVILESLAADFHQPVSWRYNQLRDQRTLVDAAGFSISDFDPDIVGVAHTPVYDSEFQVAVVTECRRLLRQKAGN